MTTAPVDKTPVIAPTGDRGSGHRDGGDKLSANKEIREIQRGAGIDPAAVQQNALAMTEFIKECVLRYGGTQLALDPACATSYAYERGDPGREKKATDKGAPTAEVSATPEAPSTNGARRESTKGNEKEENPDKKKEAVEPVKEIDGKSRGDAAIAHYATTLMEAGLEKDEASKIAERTYKRFDKLDKEGHLEGGTPAEVMAGLDKSTYDIIHATGTYKLIDENGKTQRYLADGQKDYSTDASRKDHAKDLAFRYMNPDAMETQGEHPTCGLESCHKQHLEAGRVGELARQEADVVNTGKTTIHERNADGTLGKERTVCVYSLGLKPDAEALEREPGNNSKEYSAAHHFLSGSRGMAGLVADQIHGQVVADLKAERQGMVPSAKGIQNASYIYMANNGGYTNSGEGLYEQVKGRGGKSSLKLLDDNPATGGWDLAALNKATGGFDGAVFANAKLGLIPEQDKWGNVIQTDSKHRPIIDPVTGRKQDWDKWDPNLKLTEFKDIKEAHASLSRFEALTGQSGVLFVDAPFLPGGGRDGHGGHAINASANADGTFNIKNNWGADANLSGVSAAAMDTATNPDKWNVEGGGSRPGLNGDMVPGTGRNPNEKDREEAKKREEQQKEEEEARRAREARERAEQAAAEQQQAQLRQQAQYQYQSALSAWAGKAAEAHRLGTPIPEQPVPGAHYD